MTYEDIALLKQQIAELQKRLAAVEAAYLGLAQRLGVGGLPPTIK